eukprot:Phypoly_transcript_07964.p1 GENE.Phypoly_transcript_07964~~Phypoly_transcript_07964.p1  ORF type:complete len:148 (+),score=16.50 Phypoly_transcript_07964:32-475(+)
MEFLEWLIILLLIIWAGVVILNRLNVPFTSPVIKFPYGAPPQSKAQSTRTPQATKNFATIVDKYKTYAEVQDALRAAGLESSNLIIGVDYTKSNEYTGKRTFGGKSLHYIDSANPSNLNPYPNPSFLSLSLSPYPFFLSDTYQNVSF